VFVDYFGERIGTLHCECRIATREEQLRVISRDLGAFVRLLLALASSKAEDPDSRLPEARVREDRAAARCRIVRPATRRKAILRAT